MLNFILMTVSIAIAILLASVVACIVMLNPKVLKWYLRYVQKVAENIINDL